MMRACLLLTVLSVALIGSRVAHADWVDTRRAGPFRIYAEFDLEKYDWMIDAVREQRADVAATLGLKPVNAPIVICLFANQSSYVRYVAEHAPTGVNRRALFVKGEDAGFVYVFRHTNLETDLRHEVTHAILHSMLPFLPLWLDEGLAEYFEVRAQRRSSGNPHHSRMKWASRFGWKPNLARLESREELSQFTAADYREAWAWVHFLLHGSKEGRQLLQNYLATIQQRRPPGPLSRHLERVFSDPRSQLARHLRSRK